MRHVREFTAICIILLMASSAAGLSELGYGEHQVSVIIESGDDLAYIIPMERGDRLKVDLWTADGQAVDYYLTNLTAYKAYSSGLVNSLYYIAAQSREDSPSIQYTYDSLVGSDYVILIDNTANIEGGAYPSGPVDIQGTISLEANIWTYQNIIITIAVVSCIIAFVCLLRWPRRKA